MVVRYFTAIIWFSLLAETACGQGWTIPNENVPEPPTEQIVQTQCTVDGCTNCGACGSGGDSILRRLEALENRNEVTAKRDGWFATGGVRIVQPRGVQLPVTILGRPNSALYDFDFDTAASPFFLAEYVNKGGLGFRTTYWYSSIDGRAVPDLPTDPLFELTIETHVADFLITQDVDFGFASVVYNGGVRGLVTDRDSDQEPFNVRVEEFRGVGPTVSYEFRRPFGNWGALYHSLGGSLLYGTQEHTGTDRRGRPVRHKSDAYLPIADVDVGFELYNLFGTPVDTRATCYSTIIRDIAYLGLHLHAGFGW